MISENSDSLFIESNTMLGDDNDWGAPEVEQWEGIYKGHDFLLDRIYENPQEPDADGHIYYDSFRWDWTELPSDEIVDSMGLYQIRYVILILHLRHGLFQIITFQNQKVKRQIKIYLNLRIQIKSMKITYLMKQGYMHLELKI